MPNLLWRLKVLIVFALAVTLLSSLVVMLMHFIFKEPVYGSVDHVGALAGNESQSGEELIHDSAPSSSDETQSSSTNPQSLTLMRVHADGSTDSLTRVTMLGSAKQQLPPTPTLDPLADVPHDEHANRIEAWDAQSHLSFFNMWDNDTVCKTAQVVASQNTLQQIVDAGNVGIELVTLLGSGKTGIVYRGRNKENGEWIVIKFQCACKRCKKKLIVDASSYQNLVQLNAECVAGAFAKTRSPFVAACQFDPSSRNKGFILLDSIPDSFVALGNMHPGEMPADIRQVKANVLSAIVQFLTPSSDGLIIVHNDLDFEQHVFIDKLTNEIRFIDFGVAYLCAELVPPDSNSPRHRTIHSWPCTQCRYTCEAHGVFADLRDMVKMSIMIESEFVGGFDPDKKCHWDDIDDSNLQWPFNAEEYVKQLVPRCSTVSLETWRVLRWIAAAESEIASKFTTMATVDVKQIEHLRDASKLLA